MHLEQKTDVRRERAPVYSEAVRHKHRVFKYCAPLWLFRKANYDLLRRNQQHFCITAQQLVPEISYLIMNLLHEDILIQIFEQIYVY